MSNLVYLAVRDRETGQSVMEALVALDVQTSVFYSPVDMLDELTKHAAPSLIILDLHIEEMDGWRICSLIHSSQFEHLNQTPIIIASKILPDYCLEAISESIGAQGFLALPMRPDETAAIVSSSLTVGRIVKKPTVLLVDDNPNSCDFIRTGLALSGYEVLTVTTAEEGLRLAKDTHPAVLILDHLLGDNTTSLDLLPEILQHLTNPLSVTIAITASDETDIPAKYLGAGADAYIKKPFSIIYMLTTIHRALRDKTFRIFERVIENRTSELRIAEEMFRDLFDNAPVGYHTLSDDGTILSMNRTELEWLHCKQEDVLGRKIFDIQSESSAMKGLEAFDELKRTGTIKDLELDFKASDNSIIPVRIDSRAIFDSNGRMISARSITRNVTELRQLESNLAHAQQMESAAVLSDGIAHNFNTLLTPILINAAELLETVRLKEDEREALLEIVEAARKGAQLVKQLAQLKRSPFSGTAAFDVAAVVKETAQLLMDTCEKTHTFSTQISDSGRLWAEGNPDQVRQSLINLCLNARDSMPNGGTIELSTYAASTATDPKLYAACKRSPFIVISVSDTGSGIDPSIKERIFDPFFTTRGLANHSGLGLTIAYALIRDLGGFINIRSDIDKGTDASIYLPACPPETAEHTSSSRKIYASILPEQTADKESADNLGTILVIDDEIAQLKTASRLLEHAGYKVITSQSPSAAVELLQSFKSQAMPGTSRSSLIDLIIPGESGEILLPKLKAVTGRIPVVVASGSTDRLKATRLFNLGVHSIISKPYEKATMLRTVQVAITDSRNPERRAR
jgi:two-component system cell cycle sensor histidine kinase/response regulator CckA